jgi:hypothetical protein
LRSSRKVWIGTLAVLALLVWVSVDSSEVRAAKRALEDSLIDVDSVQYRNVRTYSEGVVCGEVNAKNRLGGYAGYQLFVFNGDEDGEIVVDRVAHAEYYCNDEKGKRKGLITREMESAERLCNAPKDADVRPSVRQSACEEVVDFKARLSKL